MGRFVEVEVVLVLLVSLMVGQGSATSYRGRLALHPFTVGPPEQITVTLGGVDAQNKDSCVISWVSILNASTPQYYQSDNTFDADNASAYHSEVQWSKARWEDDAPIYRAFASIYTEARCGVSRLMNSVHIRDCPADTPIFYRVQTLQSAPHKADPTSGWSDVLQFKLPNRQSNKPISFAVVADMDARTKTAMDAVGKAVDAGEAEFAVHCGDIAYNLDDDCGTVGDAFFNRLQEVASKVPYIFAPGDHEEGRKYDQFSMQPNGFDYEGFRNRMGHATNAGQLVMARASGSLTLDFFSFEARHIHWIILNTNVFLQPQLYPLAPVQYEWLKRDLASVNRTRTPWVFVSAHRQMYCVKTDDNECNSEALSIRWGIPTEAFETGQPAAWFPYTDDTPRSFGLEPLFIEHNVDLYLAGHTHHYQRTWPLQNAKADKKSYNQAQGTVYVTAGLCSSEGSDPFVNPMASWEAFRDTQFRIGYSHITVYNSTHLTFEQRLAEDPTQLIDSFTIVRTSHQATSSNRKTLQIGIGIGIGLALLAAVAVVSYVSRRRGTRYSALHV